MPEELSEKENHKSDQNRPPSDPDSHKTLYFIRVKAIQPMLPTQLLYIASQFASKDDWKPNINGINIKRKEDQITITSTDGFRAFRCTFENPYFMEEEELNLSVSAFKKRIPKGKVTTLKDGMATVMDDKNQIIVVNPYETLEVEYPKVDQIWPDSFKNDSGEPITIDPNLLADFLIEMKRYGTGRVKMEFNKKTNPLQFSGVIDCFGTEFNVEFLLMPVLVRD